MRKAIFAATVAIIIIAFAFMASSSMSNRFFSRDFSLPRVRAIDSAAYELGGETGETRLPRDFAPLPPRTPLVLTSRLNVMPGDSLLIKMFYSPLKVYADGRLIFQSSNRYPSFMKDPPTVMSIVPLPENARTLRMEYLSPVERDRIETQTFLVGSPLALFVTVLKSNYVSFLFGMFITFFGVIAVFLSLFLLREIPHSLSLCWLGFFALSVGLWGIGECDLSLFFIPYPTLLYLMAFAGLFAVPAPLTAYVIATVESPRKKPLYLILGASLALLAAAFLLQATGKLAFSRSMIWFHLFIPLEFFGVVIWLVVEYARSRNVTARRFFPPITILAVFSVLEVVNYKYRFTNELSLFFEVGVAFFIVSLGIVSGKFMRDSIRTQREKQALETNMRMVERSMDYQEEQYALMLGLESAVKTARHDMRHHIAVLGDLNGKGDSDAVGRYLREMAARLPAANLDVICENSAVNAIAGYYISFAAASGVKTDVKLWVPRDTGRVTDTDLCVIVGNLLENALEACARMRSGERFIRAYSAVENGALSIIVENSFDGTVLNEGGAFMSRKANADAGKGVIPPQEGIGILSVRAVCSKYGGLAEFAVSSDVWKASALVDMEGGLSGGED
ncbi:MAG: GHKL domain-containing protein [Synergistaceae bacterium]|jgi:hypothetical protein|nr:GHKL domain-containing protein [Synergistaceae bacterium]